VRAAAETQAFPCQRAGKWVGVRAAPVGLPRTSHRCPDLASESLRSPRSDGGNPATEGPCPGVPRGSRLGSPQGAPDATCYPHALTSPAAPLGPRGPGRHSIVSAGRADPRGAPSFVAHGGPARRRKTERRRLLRGCTKIRPSRTPVRLFDAYRRAEIVGCQQRDVTPITGGAMAGEAGQGGHHG